MPEELKGHATVTLHVDMDHQAVQSVIKEGVTSLTQLVDLVVDALKKELASREPFELDGTQSYDMKLKVHLLETADGKEAPQAKSKLDLLMNPD